MLTGQPENFGLGARAFEDDVLTDLWKEKGQPVLSIAVSIIVTHSSECQETINVHGLWSEEDSFRTFSTFVIGRAQTEFLPQVVYQLLKQIKGNESKK